MMSCARSAVLLLTLLGLSGCAVIGPESITAGRGVYNEVINQTEDEQILNMLVRQRYGQTYGMISVSSITANLQFSARADTEVGIGDSDDYAGNLVPFSAGVGYEENPTISYVPLGGEDFLRRMLTPVELREWMLLTQMVSRDDLLFILAIRSVNGLRNELLRGEPVSPEFLRFTSLVERLRLDGVLDVAGNNEAGRGTDYFWYIHDYGDTHRVYLRELFGLIGISAKLDGSPIILPLREAIGRSNSAINIRTRSAYSVLQLFGSGIEIPPAHLDAGLVEPLETGLPQERRIITIRSSQKRPDNATVQVRFRDWWFYIDATDTQSKLAFRFLRTFIGMRLADPVGTRNAPVITVPVK